MEQKLSPRKIRESIYQDRQPSSKDIKIITRELIEIFGKKLDILESFLEYLFEGKWIKPKNN